MCLNALSLGNIVALISPHLFPGITTFYTHIYISYCSIDQLVHPLSRDLPSVSNAKPSPGREVQLAHFIRIDRKTKYDSDENFLAVQVGID